MKNNKIMIMGAILISGLVMAGETSAPKEPWQLSFAERLVQIRRDARARALREAQAQDQKTYERIWFERPMGNSQTNR